MTEIETPMGAAPTARPWGAIVPRTIVWGCVAGAVAGVITPFFLLGGNGASLVLVGMIVGGAISAVATLVGLSIGAAIWGALGLVRVPPALRSAIAAASPAVVLALAWFLAIIPTGYAAGIPALTVLLSVVIVATAVVLPWRMRRRFLDAIAADSSRVARHSS